MTKSKMLSAVILAVTSLVSAPLFAQDSSGDRSPITDPEVLESMGFPSDADNVYKRSSDNFDMRLDSDAEFTTDTLVTPQAGVRRYSGISAKEFIGRLDTTGSQWAWAGGPSCCVDLSRAGTERFADAQLDLQDAVTLDGIRWWIYDANTTANASVFVFENCQPAFASGPITINTIVSTSTSGSSGHQSGFVSISPAITVNNRDCTYLVRVRFDAASTNLALQKVRAQYID